MYIICANATLLHIFVRIQNLGHPSIRSGTWNSATWGSFSWLQNVNGAFTPLENKPKSRCAQLTGDVFNDIKSCRYESWLLFDSLWDVLHYQISYCARVMYFGNFFAFLRPVFLCHIIALLFYWWLRILLDLSGCFRDEVDHKSAKAPSLVMWLDPAGMG